MISRVAAPHGARRLPDAAAAFLMLAPVLGVAAGLLPGCKTVAQGVRPAVSYTVPEWSSLDIKTLAYLGAGSSVGEEASRQAAEELSEQHLLGAQDRFVILGFTASQERAASVGASDLFDRARRGWHDRRILDQFVVKDLCGKLTVDGLILGDLSDWKRERVDFTQEGTSYTQIGFGLAIYSGRTGLEAWSAEQMLRRDSAVYTPAAGGSGVFTDDSGASRAQRSGSMTPEPPRPEEIMESIMNSLIAAFPPTAAP
jgi:hypothetical protein